MELPELGLPPGTVEILVGQGVTSLYPPQEEAVPLALSGRNLVLAIPTASGKSLVAYLAIVKRVLEGERAIYIVPLRALAQEKYEDLKRFEPLGLRVAITTGDLDSADAHLSRKNVVVCTSEKADSLLRHRARWMSEVGIIVVDEVHLISDPSRGPTMEVLLTRLRRLNPRAQVIALSATIKNSRDIASWLGAEHVESDWRPVELREGIYLDGSIRFSNNTAREVPQRKDDILALVEDTVREGGQCIVFVNTRKSSQSVALKVSRMLGRIQGALDASAIDTLGGELDEAETERTGLGDKLRECMSNGAAFHHAGLSSAQRHTVERGFKDGTIRCISATPTLAAGINLPARRVIVRDLKRFDVKYGSVSVPVMEVKQMCGRAGRPGLDPYGEAVLLARDDEERLALLEYYLLGEPEEIRSRLTSEAALRSHILALVATDAVRSEDELQRFMDETFLSYQGALWSTEGAVEEVLGFLDRHGFITAGKGLEATQLGRRTSDLYLDPISALTLKGALEKETDDGVADIAYLHAICSTPDMPTLYMRRSDYGWVEGELERLKGRLLIDTPDDPGEYEFHCSALKTARLLVDWVSEMGEASITDRFNIGPGDVHREVEMADWLLYSMSEISRLLHAGHEGVIVELSSRIRYGVRAELLDLVKLRGVGRKRARLIYNAGFRRREDLVDVEPERLSRATGIGKKVAIGIIEQVEALVRGV